MTSKTDLQSASKEPSETAWEKLGITPLMRAARIGELESCQHLLDSGAEVDTTDEAGWTALMSAAAEGHERIVQLLLDHGADVDSESFDGATALHAATAYRHSGVVRQLLEAGVDHTPWMRGRGPSNGLTCGFGELLRAILATPRQSEMVSPSYGFITDRVIGCTSFLVGRN